MEIITSKSSSFDSASIYIIGELGRTPDKVALKPPEITFESKDKNTKIITTTKIIIPESKGIFIIGSKVSADSIFASIHTILAWEHVQITFNRQGFKWPAQLSSFRFVDTKTSIYFMGQVINGDQFHPFTFECNFPLHIYCPEMNIVGFGQEHKDLGSIFYFYQFDLVDKHPHYQSIDLIKRCQDLHLHVISREQYEEILQRQKTILV